MKNLRENVIEELHRRRWICTNSQAKVSNLDRTLENIYVPKK